MRAAPAEGIGDTPAMPPRHLLPLLLALPFCLSQASVRMASHTPSVGATDSSAASALVAQLRVEPTDGEYLAWADNLLAGPVEVRLTSTGGDTLPSSPALPARASVPAGGSTLVARLGARGTGRRGAMQLSLSAVPGSSNARPLDVDYLMPLRGSARIDQGFEGSFSHHDAQNRYALDFAADVGTPVHAARAGIVMQAEAGFRRSGSRDARDAQRANFIRILHDDGSMAIYAHLERGSIEVAAGQRVETGTVLAKSGNSGYSSGPHLHFSVQVNRGMRLESMPVKIETPAGELRLPRTMAQP